MCNLIILNRMLFDKLSQLVYIVTFVVKRLTIVIFVWLAMCYGVFRTCIYLMSTVQLKCSLCTGGYTFYKIKLGTHKFLLTSAIFQNAVLSLNGNFHDMVCRSNVMKARGLTKSTKIGALGCFGFRSECRWRQKSVSASLRGIK